MKLRCPPHVSRCRLFPWMHGSTEAAAIVIIASMSFMQGSARADELDDLLNPPTVSAELVDQSATKAWNEVVDSFRRNDLNKAADLGQAFLDADFRPSPFQLLGVQVMMGLANAENPTATADATLTTEAAKLMTERSELTAKYARLQEIVRVADSRINKLTENRKQAVQAGTAAYQECVRCDESINQASREIDAMKPAIDQNKRQVEALNLTKNAKLKTDTLQLLDMLTQAGEIEAAFAVANVYIRVVGSDLEIARKQQDVIRLQAVQQKATKIVDVIVAQQKPLVTGKKFWAARELGQRSLAKVQQADDSDLARMVTSKLALDPLSINATIAKAQSEAFAIGKLSKADARKAELALQQFRSSYPDYPNFDALGMEIAGDSSGEADAKLADLVTGIESLAETDPGQASAMLAKLEGPGFDPIQRLALEARISSVRGKVIGASIKDMQKALDEIKVKLGDQVGEFLVQNRERIKTGWTGKGESEMSALLKLKIDKSAELPEVRAGLLGLDATIALIEQSKPSETQMIQMAGIIAEVRALSAATR